MNKRNLILPLCIWLTAGLCCSSARAQAVPVHSFSRQFTAWQLQRPGLLPAPARPTLTPVAGSWAYLLSSSVAPALSATEEVSLDPGLLVAQCERLKGFLLSELGQLDQWQGRIDLIINPSLPEDKGPQLTAIKRPHAWTYQLILPKRVQQEILLRSLFQTLFLEMANRHAGVQSAEIPLWLVEGMCARVQANNLGTFLLQPDQYQSGGVIWNKSVTYAELREHAPLAFQQLSWPQASDLKPEGLPLYRSCAQLFLEDLLRFNDGRNSLQAMISQLPEHWNWQTAFLMAFHSHFDQLVDVEKWWSVNYIDFARGYKTQSWSSVDCRKTLQNCLDVPTQVHFDPDHMPVEAKITLQEAIQQWAPEDALDALQRAIGGLRFLEPRATQEWRTLVRLYLKTLVDYLEASKTAQRAPMLVKHAPPILSIAKAGVIRRLDELDRQRDALSPRIVSTNLPQLSASAEPAKPGAGR